MEEQDKPASNNDLLVVEKRKTDTSMSYVKDEMSKEDLPSGRTAPDTVKQIPNIFSPNFNRYVLLLSRRLVYRNTSGPSPTTNTTTTRHTSTAESSASAGLKRDLAILYTHQYK